MTVPSDATDNEIQAMLQAAFISGIDEHNILLVDESTATVYLYAYENTNKLMNLESPRTVAFVDIGHTKATVTIVRFTTNFGEVTVEVLAQNSNREIGGREMDWLIAIP